jgi:uncharacterized lipoprotein YehR (DUF1307 family)
MTGTEIFVFVLLVSFVIVVVLSITLTTNNYKKKSKSLEEYYNSVDNSKRFRIDRLRKDLEDNDIPQYESLEIAIKLEAKGWRKTIDFDFLED